MQGTLNERDQALIRLLQANARESVSGLARKLGISRTAVQERLNRLVQNGVIEGFTVRLDPRWLGAQVSAIVSLVVDPKYNARVIAALEKLNGIDAVWSVSGRNDLVAIARAATTTDIDRILDEVGALAGVTRTESSVILSTKFDRRTP